MSVIFTLGLFGWPFVVFSRMLGGIFLFFALEEPVELIGRLGIEKSPEAVVACGLAEPIVRWLMKFAVVFLVLDAELAEPTDR